MGNAKFRLCFLPFPVSSFTPRRGAARQEATTVFADGRSETDDVRRPFREGTHTTPRGDALSSGSVVVLSRA